MPALQDLPQDSIEAISKRLKAEFELSPVEIEEMLKDYFTNLEKLLKDAESRLAAEELGLLSRTGHSIKGLAGNLGSESVAELGKFVENEAKTESSKPAVRDAINFIRRQYDALKAQKAAGA